MAEKEIVDAAIALAATFGSQTFHQLARRFSTAIASGANKKVHEFFEKISEDFTPHLEATFNRCAKIKTLLYRDEPANLLDLYVNLNFECRGSVLDDYSVIEQIQNRGKVVIWGTAGAGKTIFMRYLWITLFFNPKSRIPVFVELRNLNDLSVDDLSTYIYRNIVNTNSKVSRETFDAAVRDGTFVFMFDGFDEVTLEKREIFERQILALANSNPKLTVVVSTRPDSRLEAWQLFSTFKVKPLNQKQVVTLIQKLDFDAKIKSKFVAEIKKELYSRHESFLSNPLLATMMLLTFRHFADIPEKVHVFYEQAFDTLFAQHDALKEAYKRDFRTGYSIDLFKKYFSLFCLISYHEQRLEFGKSEIVDLLNRVFEIEGEKGDADALFYDLLNAVCIFQQDGLKYTFSHRSFQEFFAAYYLARMRRDKVGEILLSFSKRVADSVILMLFDMNHDLVEQEFVLPYVSVLCDRIRSSAEPDVRIKFMDVMGMNFLAYVDAKTVSIRAISWIRDDGLSFLMTLANLYKGKFFKELHLQCFSFIEEENIGPFRDHLIKIGEISSAVEILEARFELSANEPKVIMRQRFHRMGIESGELIPAEESFLSQINSASWQRALKSIFDFQKAIAKTQERKGVSLDAIFKC